MPCRERETSCCTASASVSQPLSMSVIFMFEFCLSVLPCRETRRVVCVCSVYASVSHCLCQCLNLSVSLRECHGVDSVVVFVLCGRQRGCKS